MARKAPKKKAQASLAALAKLSPDAPLTRQEHRFLLELLNDPAENQTQAAIRAGYSARSAHVTACQLLKRPNIAKAFADEVKKRHEALAVNADRVVGGLAEMAFEPLPDLADYYKPGTNQLKAISELTPAQRRAIQSIELVRTNVDKGDGHLDTVIKYRFWDIRASRTRNLELLARHLAILDNPEPPPNMGPVFIFPPGTHISVGQ